MLGKEGERTSEWWNKFVYNEVPEHDWKENFRMSSSSFKELCNRLKPYLQKKTTRMRDQFLWKPR